jgi:hypothetical protein
VTYAWISDQCTHFKNQVVAEVARLNMVPIHHFVVAYSPWANGSVGQGNREFLTLLRVILTEIGYPHWHLPYLLPAIQDMMVSYQQTSLAKECARKVFMNLGGTSPMRTVFLPEVPIVAELPAAEQMLAHVKQVSEAVAVMHTDVLTASKKRSESAPKLVHDKIYTSLNLFWLFLAI